MRLCYRRAEQTIGRQVTQPRIFVSYVPAARSMREGSAQRSRRAGEPAMALLAGALLAGGAVHGWGSAETGTGRRPPSGRQDSIAPALTGLPTQPRLPYLTLASVGFAPPTDFVLPADAARAPEKTAPPAAPRPASARPRRDLAGFLEDRGLTLAAAKPDVQAASAEWSDASARPDAPSGEIAATDAAKPAGSPSAVAVLAPAEAQAGALAPAEAQSFPIVAVGGQELGAVTMRGGKIHLASLVGLLQLKLPAAEFARLNSAPAADSFVDAETLRAAGIAMAHDPAGERVTLTVL